MGGWPFAVRNFHLFTLPVSRRTRHRTLSADLPGAWGSSERWRSIGGRERGEELLEGFLGARVTAFAAIVVALLGTWLVIERDFDFASAWISASYALWFVAMGLGGGVLSRHSRKVMNAALEAQQRGEETSDALIAQFRSPVANIGGTVLGLMYVVFIYLMVVKPGG